MIQKRIQLLAEKKIKVRILAFDLLLPVNEVDPDPDRYSRDLIHQMSQIYLTSFAGGDGVEYITHRIDGWRKAEEPGRLLVRGRVITGEIPISYLNLEKIK